MNYRHAFHAGNFADVLKHIVLTRILTHLLAKETPFHVLDTHAGIGLYDLGGNEASRTGEWRDGVGRLLTADMPEEVRELLQPWFDAVIDANASAGHFDLTAPKHYPGSPAITARMLRRGDQLSACELHPEDHDLLAETLKGDRQARVYGLDGWLAIKSFLPPKIRRGLVLVDPPFELPGEFERLVTALQDGTARFANGIYALWYPIKSEAEIRGFHVALQATNLKRMLAVELRVAPTGEEQGLTGTGLVILNPPWKLKAEMEAILPVLTRLLARSPRASWRVLELAGE